MTTAVSPTKEFDEATDAVLNLALRAKKMFAETGPGGKNATLDEIVGTISDGKIKAVFTDLLDSVLDIVHGGHVDVMGTLKKVSDAVLELVGSLQEALRDGKVTPDEIVRGVTDSGIRADLLLAIEGADKIPDELSGLSPWMMIGTLQRIMARLPELLAPVRG